MILWGIVGWKNSGKTGLCERLVAEFTTRGLRVSTMKHTHHGVDLEVPGTDTHRHREAGARQVLLASEARLTLMTERPPAEDVLALAARLDPVDLVLVEGWKSAPIPKIECHLQARGRPLLAGEDQYIKAVASDARPEAPCPVLPLNETALIADFIAREAGL